jgi:hypothetical protein
MINTEQLRKAIKKVRPDITESSINSYIISLRMLFDKLEPTHDKTKQLNTKFLYDFNKVKKVLDEISNKNTQKNRLTAILVALSSDEPIDNKLITQYQTILKTLMIDVNKQLNSNEKTDTQKTNWIDFDDVKKILNQMLTDITPLFKKDKLTKSEYGLLQKYVLLRFYVSNPVRNDVADCKVVSQSEYDKSDDKTKNYLVKDGNKYKFYLNQFKNVKRIGPKIINIEPNLSKILTKFFKINTSGYFFTLNNRVEPISANHITKMMNSIFKKYANGKKISTSMLRHIQISDDLKNEPTIEQKKEANEKTELKYQHNTTINDQYRKT